MHLLLSLMTGKTTEYCIQVSYKRKFGVNSMYDFDFFSRKKAKFAVSKTISESLFKKKFNIL